MLMVADWRGKMGAACSTHVEMWNTDNITGESEGRDHLEEEDWRQIITLSLNTVWEVDRINVT